ncbi:hypothetical protein DYB28_013701 [Aphanomyces astaci]|uniref:Uncharacterized protein n=1 Tax=Aphanomyces astaci TaxID=112090 RepID=A0A397BQX0_APHAT|nr:hypothetical protein DYB36_011813 [Aphanomyces astaci]RLO02812.1 hypothetical protein DYB28_013701 [Aphanomyces astaci]
MEGVAEVIVDTVHPSPVMSRAVSFRGGCAVTVDQVQAYLGGLHEMYTNMSLAVKTKQDLYHFLLHLQY